MLGKDGPVHSIPLSFPTICALGPWGECNLSFAPFVYCCRKTAANNAAGFSGVDGCTCSLISRVRGQSRTPSWLRRCFSCCRKDPVRHTHTADSIQSIIFVMFVISVTELLPQHKLQKTIAWLVHLGVRAISCSGERPGA